MRRISSSKTATFYTLGCKLNQAETNAIENQFRERGYEILPFGQESDVTVINTCTVTSQADSKSRSVIRRAAKTSPQGCVVVTGCYAQIRPSQVELIEGVDFILGTAEKHRILDYLEVIDDGGSTADSDLKKPLLFVNDRGDMETYNESTFVSSTSRTRAFLKIQEGCNYYCSYCIVPLARGKPRSRSFRGAIGEAKHLANEGFKEVVLTGINMGIYRSKNGRTYWLHDLLAALSEVDGIERIRVSSIEPNTITEELLHVVKERDNICPHLHVPLQSGSDTVLRRMHRKYTVDDFMRVIERIQSICPEAALGTDIIVGFPGETHGQFTESVDLIQSLPFTYLHVFRYSPREGTVAAKMAGQIDEEVKKERSAILREIGFKKKSRYARRFIGTVQPVLFENQRRDGDFVGLTTNYLRVRVSVESHSEKGVELSNSIRSVLLQKATGPMVKGALV